MPSFRYYSVALAQAKDWATKWLTSVYVVPDGGYYGITHSVRPPARWLVCVNADGSVTEPGR